MLGYLVYLAILAIALVLFYLWWHSISEDVKSDVDELKELLKSIKARGEPTEEECENLKRLEKQIRLKAADPRNSKVKKRLNKLANSAKKIIQKSCQ